MDQNHIEAIKTVVINSQKPPVFVTGFWSVPKDVLQLFYKHDGTAHSLQFPVSQAECEDLSKACQPATFGMNNKDVLDESYRKAGKMDRSQFSISLDGAMDVSLEDAARQLLLPVDYLELEAVKVELYKLNVYGPGSFFKPHNDTPRSDNMYGSIVVFLPAEFKGGELVLRHDDKEHTYDYNTEKENSVIGNGESLVSWIAFFSDVEHEVLPVIEGYRVTLTYNLYRSASLLSPEKLSLPYQTDLTNAIKNALNDPSFLPHGCMLGFGLSHMYPVTDDSRFSEIIAKGYDAAIMNAFHAAGVEGEIKALYDIQEMADSSDELEEGLDKVWLTRRLVHLETIDDDTPFSEPFRNLRRHDGFQVLSTTDPSNIPKAFEVTEELGLPVMLWVTMPSDMTQVKSYYVYAGNEASLSYIYANLNLVFTIPEKEKRGLKRRRGNDDETTEELAAKVQAT